HRLPHVLAAGALAVRLHVQQHRAGAHRDRRGRVPHTGAEHGRQQRPRHTHNNTAPGLTATDEAAFRPLGQSMAATNGYTPQQASDLYITDGDINDWLWGVHKTFSYTFEMYPSSSGSGGGFYPPDEVIATQTSRNRAAVIQLLDASDCVYEVI